VTGSPISLPVTVCLLALLGPATARADWLITPFVGSSFAGTTNYVDLEQGAGETKFTWGGSVALLSDGVFGLDADFGYAQRFFERDTPAVLVTGSSVMTVTGSVIAAVPLAVTRESLRPYVSGGLGLMHARLEDVLGVFPVNSRLLALSVGGGAIGFLTPRTGLRFEIRQFKNLTGEKVAGTLEAARLRFWRATVGVTFRY
jgi:hypothetical protein